MKRKKNPLRPAALVNRTSLRVRFSEVDSMHVVWHGEYIRYFEDGREAFGREFGLDYMSYFRNGYMAPIVEVNCRFKQALTVGEEAIVETRYIPCSAAKVQFDYVIYRASDNTIVATGSSTQVFTDPQLQLELNNPTFYTEWKQRWNL